LPDPSSPSIQRHYGLDWLRIGAFGLLILFHLGLYFAPGHWVVKSPVIADWVAWPLAAIVPWRLSALFAVSGYATAAMIQRCPGMLAFLAERSKRLLIPLLFGMVAIVPPQDWVRLKVAGENTSFATFLQHDAFSFAPHAGTFMPAWEHLWFLPSLWAYTLLLIGGIALVPGWKTRGQLLVSWLTAGRRLVWVPAALITGGLFVATRAHVGGLTDSTDYIPTFLLGFAYAHYPQLREGFSRQFRAAGVVSLAMLAVLWGLLAFGSASPSRTETALGLAASAVMSWTMILVTFHLAGRFLDRDHKWRQPLAAAVFPAYVVHQTVIVVVGWHLRQAGVVGLAAFLIQLTAVVGGCALAWQVAGRIPLAGILLGMPRKAKCKLSNQDQEREQERLAPA
jgi:glucan biosynthesis protein C